MIVASKGHVSLLNMGQMFARDHSLGISPLSIDCWKRRANTGPNSVANSFRTLAWSSSGPKAFEGFRPFSNFVTHYKSMGNISCHSNHSSFPTGINNIIHVEANVLRMYAKLQLHPPYGF